MAKPTFDHERLNAYREALRFVEYIDPIVEKLPARMAARDQLDRASTSISLNIAEGNGKRSHPDRCRYFDAARGSALECAACLDVLAAKKRITFEQATEGKEILRPIVAMLVGLLGAFGGGVQEDAEPYGPPASSARSRRSRS